MRIERRSSGGVSAVETFAPGIVLIFETEASRPTCIFPQESTEITRILDGLDPRWHDLLMAALEET